MVNFFAIKLSGRTLARPMILMWGSSLLFCVAYVLVCNALGASGEMTTIDVKYGLLMLSKALLWFLYGFVVLWTLLPVMNHTVEQLEYGGAKFEVEYDRKSYGRLIAGGVALSVLTLGVFLPWLVARLMRFFADGVSHKFNLLTFRGKGMRLLALTVLLNVLPSMLLVWFAHSSFEWGESLDMMSFAPLCLLLVVVLTFLFCALYMVVLFDWCIDFCYGDKTIRSKMPIWGATLYFIGQLLLVCITMGLYAPMASLRVCRYVALHTAVDNGEGVIHSMGLRLRAWSDWGFVWVQTLLLIVTFGFYLPWYYAAVMNRFTARLYVNDSK